MQVKLVAVFVQVQPVPEAAFAPAVTPVGNVSVTVTVPWVRASPPLRTVTS
ncbi:unannotated protein [freshwater metagenome]|uniref:Unannotated protein n=1 Tax=freshwater metagenome TaxID=449393 RepID=A0A6J7J4G9_9ZZZZ